MSQLNLFGEDFTPKDPPRTSVKKGGRKVVVRKKQKEEITEADTGIDNWKPEKNYYTIGEVAALFKVNTSHIRFWTNEFKFKVRTTRKGDRLYKPEQIQEIRLIYHLVKERGFTLAGARTKIREEKKITTHKLDLKDALILLKKQLTTLKEQLD